MLLRINVKTIDDVAEARASAEAVAQAGDTIEIIVGSGTPAPVAIQERKQAVGDR
jgi:hypothetical protein